MGRTENYKSPAKTVVMGKLRADQARLSRLHVIREEREDQLTFAHSLVDDVIDEILTVNQQIEDAYDALKAIERAERLERKGAA